MIRELSTILSAAALTVVVTSMGAKGFDLNGADDTPLQIAGQETHRTLSQAGREPLDCDPHALCFGNVFLPVPE